MAQTHEIDAGLRRLVEDTFRARGGKGEGLPGAAAVSGRGRVDYRFAVDHEGEVYILSKSDGMIRKVVGAKATSLTAAPAEWPRCARQPGRQESGRDEAHQSRGVNAGVDRRREEGVRRNCAACHGNVAQGAVKAGVVISIIEEQGGKQAPDLTDAQWDHGSSDGEIYAVIKKGVPPTMMAGWDGRIPDDDIWSMVNYIRTLAANK